ncbi:MAG: WD40 repeat domain-containing protein [Planctomycetes bacterium]|nr:WD40 repeat domain-containing protein [Planctomycetota bacterium]
MQFTGTLAAMGVVFTVSLATAGGFEDLGVMMKKGGHRGACVGPDATGKKELIYVNFSQEAAPLFLVSVDPETGETHQYSAEAPHPGAHGLCCGPDGKIYLGTWGSGSLLVFDPKQPEKQIQTLGKPAASESYIWFLTPGIDSRIWGATFPKAKLISYDTATGEMKDHGRSSDTEMYSQSVAVGPDGRVYTTFGTRKSDLILYDPKTGERKSIAPPELRGRIVRGWVGKCKDDQIYTGLAPEGGPPGKDNRIWFRVEGDKTIPCDVAQIPWFRWKFRDGRYLQETGDGFYGILDPKTNQWQRGTFTYDAAGKSIFMLAAGPDGCIYGSGAMPMDFFRYDPKAGKGGLIGTVLAGEVYSMLAHGGKLYSFCYSPPNVFVYDPAKPWKFGKQPEDNPRDVCPLGDGHCRPEGSVIGPDDLFYIVSHAPYGQLGGAMAIFDPKQQKVLANFRHLVKDQSLICVTWERQSNLIFVGSGVWGGGGSVETEKEGRLAVFDPVKREKVHELVPVPGHNGIKVLAAAEGKVFGVTHSNTTFVFDPQTKSVVKTMTNPHGSQVWGSFRLHTDGLIWGLTSAAIFTLNPKTCEYALVAKSPKPITAGLALTDDGVYFARNANLWRYRR